MKTVWKKGLEDDASKEVELSFNGSGLMRQHMERILKDKINASEKESITKEGYDCPNWSYKQADSAGYKRALYEIINLIK